MAINEQLIADLGEAINLSNASQQRFGANNDSFNRIIKDGLSQINATIRDIDGLLGQVTDKIKQLKKKIKELEDNGGPIPSNEIALLKEQLDAAQKGQKAATTVMNKALETLRANTVAMNRSIEVQDEPAMTKQLKMVTDSLQKIQLRLRGILNDNSDLPGEAVPQGSRGAADNYETGNDSEFDSELSKIDGGARKRRRKTKRKSKRSRRTKKKGGYGYKTKRDKTISDTSSGTGRGTSSSSGKGRGKGVYTKRKKLRFARS
jgi:uncharacterized phage infection (PIP) family protein YhgE